MIHHVVYDSVGKIDFVSSCSESLNETHLMPWRKVLVIDDPNDPVTNYLLNGALVARPVFETFDQLTISSGQDAIPGGGYPTRIRCHRPTWRRSEFAFNTPSDF
jgi:hypothetical protein